MALTFTKKSWQDESVQYPNRYTVDGVDKTIVRNVGTVTHQDPISSSEMNRIEQGVKDAVDAVNAVNVVDVATMSITTGSWIASNSLYYKDFTISGATIGSDDTFIVIPTIQSLTVAGYVDTMQVQYVELVTDSATVRVWAKADPGGTVPCNVVITRDKGGLI